MTNADRDPPDDDDPMLRSMRSVWLSMRDSDSEPPQRGLAELMAAARAQADVMKPRESWWRRSFAMFARPPVLALATVVVLIGGAVFVNKRSSDIDATHKVTRERAEEKQLAGSSAIAADKAPVAVPEAKKDVDGDMKPGAAGTPMSGEVAAPSTIEPEPVRPRAVPRPQPPRRPPPVREDAPPPQTDPPPPPPPPPKEVVTGTQLDLNKDKKSPNEGGLVIATDDNGKRPEPTTDAAAESAPTTRGSTTRGPVVSPTKVVDQLVRQTEIAAGRKDCAAVRVTAGRIKKLDNNVYKTRVANQKPIADCLR